MHAQPSPTKRTFKVRRGFHLQKGESFYAAGEEVHMTEADAQAYRHMIEPIEDAAPAHIEPKIAPDQRKKR